MEKPSLTYIKELSRGDKDFQAKLIAVVKEELPEEIALYEKNMKDSNFKEAAENVHKIKHKLGILSLEIGYELAISHEAELRMGDTKYKKQFGIILQSCTDFISNF